MDRIRDFYKDIDARLAKKSSVASRSTTASLSQANIVAPSAAVARAKTVAALKRADYVLGDSEYLMDEARKLAPIKAGKVIPWGIEEAYLNFHKNDYAFNRPLRILVPRLHETVYNNLFIVGALRTLLEERDIEMAFPSFGSLADDFRDTISNMQLGGVTLYEKLPRESYLKFASRFDLCLSASRSDSSPASLIEAMALGLIPVAAKIRGVKEWLTPETGYLFEQDNAEQLLGTIEKLVSSGDPHTSLRQKNLERVKQEAVFEKNIADQIKIMYQLTGRHDG